MGEYINYLENLYSNNFTDSISFNDETNLWFINNEKNLIIIKSELLGGKDKLGKKIDIDRLLSSAFIEFFSEKYGIYIPNEELMKRKNPWYLILSVV
mgnify:CR=1 FL=1